MTPEITVVPANQASWEDLQAIFGTRGYTSTCYYQRFKVGQFEWTPMDPEERAWRLRVESGCGDPTSRTTSGLVAYLDGEPVGWCAVEPRTAYPRLPIRRVALAARGEDPDDASVWAVTCFVTRAGYRRRGISRVLAAATVEFARARGARALEGYPMITQPGEEVSWGDVHVGSRSIFEDAGFTQVTQATPRRVMMRIDF